MFNCRSNSLTNNKPLIADNQQLFTIGKLYYIKIKKGDIYERSEKW